MESLIFQYLSSILSLVGLVMIALISPGPDFAIVVRNSLIYSRKTGLFTALGIALGILVHVSYTLLGLGLVIAKNPWTLVWIFNKCSQSQMYVVLYQSFFCCAQPQDTSSYYVHVWRNYFCGNAGMV